MLWQKTLKDKRRGNDKDCKDKASRRKLPDPSPILKQKRKEEAGSMDGQRLRCLFYINQFTLSNGKPQTFDVVCVLSEPGDIK